MLIAIDIFNSFCMLYFYAMKLTHSKKLCARTALMFPVQECVAFTRLGFFKFTEKKLPYTRVFRVQTVLEKIGPSYFYRQLQDVAI